MRHSSLIIVACAATTLTACAGLSKMPPVSTDSIGPPEQMPQPANGLPLGSAVDAPILSPGESLSTTRIGPSTAMPTTAAPGSSPLAYPPRRIQ